MLPQVATLAALRGDLAGAEQCVDTLRNRWRRIEFAETNSAEALACMCLWLVRKEQGRLDELAPDILTWLGSPALPDPRWIASARAALGDPGGAEAALAGLEIVRVGQWYAGGGYALLEAEVVTGLTLQDLADRAATELEPYIAEGAQLGTAGCYGPLALPLGRLAALAGRTELAERSFRRAIELSDRGGWRVPSTWARIHLAQLLARDGRDGDESAALLAEAAATADELGLTVAAAASHLD